MHARTHPPTHTSCPTPQVDQGLGIGTGAPFFNRCTAQATRFLQLLKPGRGSKSPPLSLVLHGRVGNAIGDLPAYDAFLLGGPHSGGCDGVGGRADRGVNQGWWVCGWAGGLLGGGWV